jgi:hypothetical protein
MHPVHVNEVLKIAAAIDSQYQVRDCTESARAAKVLMIHLGIIDGKADAAKRILRRIQKLAKARGMREIERNAKEAIGILK